MRLPVTLIAIALAVLSLAVVRPGGDRPLETPAGAGASALAAQPAPDLAWPAVIGAVVTTPASVQMRLAPRSRRHLRPAEDVFTASLPPQLIPDLAARRRSFPLLI